MGLLATAAFSQQKPTKNSLSAWLDRIYAQQEAARLKSYYTDLQTADLCETWRSCSKWAFEEYVKDQSFKIVKAKLKTQRKVYRHRVTQETHLFVEATYTHRTVYLEFITPQASGRQQPYRYIVKFPQK